MTWELAVGCVDLFPEFVNLQSHLLLLLASRHGLRLDCRQLGDVDSTPSDVGVGADVGEVLGGGDEVWILDHAEWIGHGGKWCVLVSLDLARWRRDLGGVGRL